MRSSQSYKEYLKKIPTPAFVVYEDFLRENLEKLKGIERECGVKIIMALKANALWKTFKIIKEYFPDSTASSLNEMELSNEFLGGDVHAYCPVYTIESFSAFLKGCSHITFNSLRQFDKFIPLARDYEKATGKHVSMGLRVNPKCSVIEHDIYNPAMAGSRFGMSADRLPAELPEEIEGLHFHALCECGPEELQQVLNKFEQDFGKYLDKLKWVNFGGGHLITRSDYNVELLREIIKSFRLGHPHLKIIMEPGSAFTWQTGDLIVKVLDVVEDEGIKTAIIDASFACHMPDCLEMPYQPEIEESISGSDKGGEIYRIGGNSCLSGDFVGNWKFENPLQEGDRLTLKDMNHYTTVKTNMFNGISHPSLWLIPSLTKTVEGKENSRSESVEPVLLREYNYEDYKGRMD